jgi:hypothetical protein
VEDYKRTSLKGIRRRRCGRWASCSYGFSSIPENCACAHGYLSTDGSVGDPAGAPANITGWIACLLAVTEAGAGNMGYVSVRAALQPLHRFRFMWTSRSFPTSFTM